MVQSPVAILKMTCAIKCSYLQSPSSLCANNEIKDKHVYFAVTRIGYTATPCPRLLTQRQWLPTVLLSKI